MNFIFQIFFFKKNLQYVSVPVSFDLFVLRRTSAGFEAGSARLQLTPREERNI